VQVRTERYHQTPLGTMVVIIGPITCTDFRTAAKSEGHGSAAAQWKATRQRQRKGQEIDSDQYTATSLETQRQIVSAKNR
jgi:hypothetical protein